MPKKSPQLHELLAVEPSLKKTALAVVGEAVNTFTKKMNHFFGQTRRYSPIDDEGYKFPDEDVPVIAGVHDKLTYVGTNFARFLDAVIQKEQTNTRADAELIIDGESYHLSATALLSMESALAALKPALLAIPTLPPGELWEKDSDNNLYQTEPKNTTKMKKLSKPMTLAPATKEHPAQVQMITEDTPIGIWTTQLLSTAFTVAEKSKVLGRIDDLMRDVKRARTRANMAPVDTTKIGKQVMKYILGS